jgi:PAS domain-containing protein
MSDRHRNLTSQLLHVILIILAGLSVPLYLTERQNYKESLEQFGEALTAADAGRWYWDLKTNELRWDSQMFVLFGRIQGHWSPNYGGFEAALHPEDKDRVNALVLKAIESRGGYQDVFRIITSSGDVKDIRSSAMVSRNGKYMTGLCLPAINRPGNFLRIRSLLNSRSVRGIPIPGLSSSGPAVTVDDFNFSTGAPTVIQN